MASRHGIENKLPELTAGEKSSLVQRSHRAAERNPQRIVDLSRQYSLAAIRTLATIMDDKDEPAAVRVRCAEILIERGYGKAAQSVTIKDETAPADPGAMTLMQKIQALRLASVEPPIELEMSQARELKPVEEDLVG